MKRNWHRRHTRRHIHHHFERSKKFPVGKIILIVIGILLIVNYWEDISTFFEVENDNQTSSIFSNIPIFKSESERKEECMVAFNRLNEIRGNYGKSTINWDDRAYTLAVARSKDMYERNYFDHVTPEGTCVKDMKSNYGFSNSEYLAENAGGMSYYRKGNVAGDCYEALEGWTTSRGHRYNLLYDMHNSGAIGCYYEICIFLGVHTDPYGLGAGECTTGDEGLAYWESIEKQPGEI